MKKKLALIAGLLLVSGQIFGSNIRLKHTNFEATYNLLDSIYGPGSIDTGRNWDAYLRFQTEIGLDLGNHGHISTFIDLSNVDTQNTSSIDGQKDYKDARSEHRTIKMHYTNSFRDFTVGMSALLFDGSDKDQQIRLETLQDDSTYMKWNVMGSKDLSLTFYPYAVPLSWNDWRTNETFDFNDEDKEFYQPDRPGFAIDYRVNDTLSTTFKLAKLDSNNYMDKDNNFAYKGVVNTQIAGFNLNSYYASTTLDKDDNLTAYGIMASTNLIDSTTIRIHFNTEKEGSDDLKTWIYAGGEYYFAPVNNYNITAFGSILLENDAAAGWFDGDLQAGLWTESGSLTTIEAGVRLAQGNFAITPTFNLYIAENETFGEKGEAVDNWVQDDNDNWIISGKKGKASSKTAYSLGIKFSHSVWN